MCLQPGKAEDVGKNSHDVLPKHLSLQFLLGGKVHAKNEDYLTCWNHVRPSFFVNGVC